MSMLNPNDQEQLSAMLFEQTAQKVKQQILEGQYKKRQTETTQGFFKDRPQNNIFEETGHEQDQRVRLQSPFGNLRSWRLIKIIVKSNDDVRQEPYEILATGQRCGLIEVVSDALSIDSIKRRMGQNSKFADYFVQQFGDKKSKKHKKAQDNFCKSLASYSLVCYILQIKDRHNGNILVDIEGHIIHIDFGFLLSNAPGKGFQFEQAPFKLTQDMVDKFLQFRELMRIGFMALQEHADKIVKLVEMMYYSQSDLPCFKVGENLIKEIKQRLLPLGHLLTEMIYQIREKNKMECAKYVDSLIENSYDNWRTKAYDRFQYCCQGIL